MGNTVSSHDLHTLETRIKETHESDKATLKDDFSQKHAALESQMGTQIASLEAKLPKRIRTCDKELLVWNPAASQNIVCVAPKVQQCATGNLKGDSDSAQCWTIDTGTGAIGVENCTAVSVSAYYECVLNKMDECAKANLRENNANCLRGWLLTESAQESAMCDSDGNIAQASCLSDPSLSEAECGADDWGVHNATRCAERWGVDALFAASTLGANLDDLEDRVSCVGPGFAYKSDENPAPDPDPIAKKAAECAAASGGTCSNGCMVAHGDAPAALAVTRKYQSATENNPGLIPGGYYLDF